MMIQSKLVILENRIDSIMGAYRAVLKERDMLLEEKKDLQSIIDKIKEENNILKAERDTVRQRIEVLAGKL